MDMRSNIYVSIADEVIEVRGSNAMLSRSYILRDLLIKFEPTTPDDETYGFIAYAVPDKDRMKMKTGKFLTRKLKLNTNYLNDLSLRRIADSINSIMNPTCDYRLDSGEAILQNYQNCIGGNSCMCGSYARYVGMYVDNPRVYRQAIMICGNDSARAMVIKLDSGNYFMDRIYSTNSDLIDKMIDNAKSNGWFYRRHTSAGSFAICTCIGEQISDYSNFTVSDLEYTDGEVPYQDTLTLYKLSNNGKLSIAHNDSGLLSDGVLDSTEGYVGESNMESCYNCGGNYSQDELIYSERTENDYCESCYSETFSTCDRCEETEFSDDMIHVEDVDQYWCESCVDNYAYKCSACSELNTTDFEVVEDNTYCFDCAESECSRCENCDELFIKGIDYEKALCETCQAEIKEDAKILAYPHQRYIPQI